MLKLTDSHWKILEAANHRKSPDDLTALELETFQDELEDAGLLNGKRLAFGLRSRTIPLLTEGGKDALLEHFAQKIKAEAKREYEARAKDARARARVFFDTIPPHTFIAGFDDKDRESWVKLFWGHTVEDWEACHEFARAKGFVWPSEKKNRGDWITSLFTPPRDKSRLDATYSQGVLAGKEKSAEDVAFWRENSRECSKRNNALTDKVRDLEKEAESMHLALLASDKTIARLEGIKDSLHRDLNRALRAKAGFKDMLEKMEWGVSREINTGFFAFTDPCCPICGNPKDKGHDKSCVLGACLKSEEDGFDKAALLKQVRKTAAEVASGEWHKDADARPWITPGQWDMLVKVLGEVQVKNNFRRIGDGKP